MGGKEPIYTYPKETGPINTLLKETPPPQLFKLYVFIQINGTLLTLLFVDILQGKMVRTEVKCGSLTFLHQVWCFRGIERYCFGDTNRNKSRVDIDKNL